MDSPRRIVCHFSCGAASAVATKLAIEQNAIAAFPLPVVVIYCHVEQEHEDNWRFLQDCQTWFGVEIKVLSNKKYDGNVVHVIRRERYINGSDGAPCTKLLKKEPARLFAEFGDLNVYGYSSEEEDRYDRWIDANNDKLISAPLIDRGLDKGACLAIVARAGIKLPILYEMGYDHNNCIGCVKGGAWYWNKIRVDFPERFQEQMELEEWLGHPTLRINGESVWLRDLAPGRGRKHEEPNIECGVACVLAERDIYAAGLL
jgi:3'-phosphoadenosine 5'-phosphosulfate sulfotransferase (PAPS reductase)/FAD synthetase